VKFLYSILLGEAHMNRSPGKPAVAAIMLWPRCPPARKSSTGSFEDDYNGWTLEEVPRPAHALERGESPTPVRSASCFAHRDRFASLQGGLAFDSTMGSLLQSSPSLSPAA